jgi:hypothetical protein
MTDISASGIRPASVPYASGIRPDTGADTGADVARAALMSQMETP